MAYAGGWKKLEPMWDVIIRAKRATSMLPVLEEVLSGFGKYRPWAESKETTMETKAPTPIRIALPVAEEPLSPRRPDIGDALTPRPPLPTVGEGWGEGLPDDGAPRFIPLAVAIDLGMTPPIGSIRTTEVEIQPSDTAKPPHPARRHLRLLPSPGN